MGGAGAALLYGGLCRQMSGLVCAGCHEGSGEGSECAGQGQAGVLMMQHLGLYGWCGCMVSGAVKTSQGGQSGMERDSDNGGEMGSS
jgi:hypothetical protein